MNTVGSKWIYETKFKSNGLVECSKARLVAQDYAQVSGVDFDETFTHVIKPTTICISLSITMLNKWCI